MAKPAYHIDIDSYIGEYYYSKRFVRNELAKYPNQEVKVRMNSMGGNVDHGLDIAERFGEHGNVTVDMFAMNASAATLATLKAKKVRMSANGLYLIHKVMNWVDIWGQLNADQIAEEIQKLEANKQENDKIDLMIAQMYAVKTGRPVNEMLQLMKVGGWLTAKEALNYGFIDEIIPSGEKMNMKAIGDKLNSFGLPTNFIGQNNFFSNITNSQPMKKQPIKVNAILKVNELASSDEGVFLNEDQIHQIDAHVTTLENSVTAITGERDAAVTAQQTAEQNLTAEQTKVTERDNTIADLKNQIANLKKGAGATTTEIVTEVDNNAGGEKFDNSEFEVFSNAKKLHDLLP